MGEFERIRRFLDGWKWGAEVKIPPGDDASAVTLSEGSGEFFLQTTDLLIEEVHFRRDWGSPFQLGWKALAVNLSDIAAMGGEPRHTHLSLAVPEDYPESDLFALMEGFKALANRYRVALLGGDLSRSPEHLVISVMVDGVAPGSRVLRRSGAQPGDVIWVSRALGGAAAGMRLLREDAADAFPDLVLNFLQPQPEVELGELCSQSRKVHALIDLSDGLTGDLEHILAASGGGADLRAADLPLHPMLPECCRERDWDVLDLALNGGEGYQLLGCTPADDFDAFSRLAAERLQTTIFPIGRFTSSPGIRLKHPDGSVTEVTPASWDHFST